MRYDKEIMGGQAHYIIATNDVHRYKLSACSQEKQRYKYLYP
jgi:hypothetical protein